MTILKNNGQRVSIPFSLIVWLLFTACHACFSQTKKITSPKFTLEAGPAISVPGNSFEYSGSVVGLGMKAQLNNNLSSKWTVDLYADYHIFFGYLKSYPKPPFKPRMLSLMPGIKFYPLPVLFMAYHMGITCLGPVDKNEFKTRFSYNPSLGISFPTRTRRINFTLGYVHIVDSPKPSGYINAGISIRIL